MAQFFNVVTNANGTFTIEDLQQICSIDGQSVQFVIEDVNNGTNVVSQPILCTSTDNNEPALYSQINLEAHTTTAELESRSNVFIIKTDPQLQQSILTKVESINDNSNDNKEVKDHINICYTQPQLPNNESIEVVIKKDPSSVKPVTTHVVRAQHPTTSTTVVSRNIGGQGSDKKPTRLVPLNKQIAGVSTSKVILKNTLQGANTQTAKAGKMRRNSNVANSPNVAVTARPRASTGCVAALVTPPRGPQARPSIHPETSQRNSISGNATRNVVPAQASESLISLSERISRSVLNQRQQQNDLPLQTKQAPPVMVVAPTTRLGQLPTSTARQQRQPLQRTMGNLFTSGNSRQQQQQQQQQLQQQQQQLQQQLQLQQQQQQLQQQQQKQAQLQLQQLQQQQLLQRQTGTVPNFVATQTNRQVSTATVTVTDNDEPMEIDSSEVLEQIERLNQQINSSKSESEENSSESVAYLQEEIHDPTNAIVQQQITGNEAKMLVILENGEQRLITFEVPKEDCTVQDLLEQAAILSSQEPRVSLVLDPALGINYIVDVTKISIYDEDQHAESTSSDTSMTTAEQTKTLVKSNSLPSPTATAAARGPPKIIHGMLAVCSYCGMSDTDFNACSRCKRKLPETVKAIPVSPNAAPKKDNNTLSVESFYKKPEPNQKVNHESIAKRGRGGRGRASSTRITRQIKEPECLTISSDEEDDNKKQKQQEDPKDILNSLHPANNEESGTISDKEPVITAKTISKLKSLRIIQTASGENVDCIPTTNQLSTFINCRTVRIGSYKYVPTDNIELTSNGIKLEVPLLEDNKNIITVNIKIEDIIAVLLHFNKAIPVFFFYTDAATALRIRDLLGMQDPKGPYFDPTSKDQSHKRITLLPERILEESKILLRNMYKSIIKELDSKEANDILVKASPKTPIYTKNQIQTRSETKKSMNSTSFNGEIQTITVYPPPPAKGGIAINTEDYICLAEDQFLNDVIIDFYLKYLMLQGLSRADHDRTHVFSSYFYKRLTSPHTQAGGNTENISAAARRHARVQKWTKNVNIFEKDFVVIPINEHAHWFLAIICFPGLVGKVIQKVEAKSLSEKLAEKKKKDQKAQAVTIGSTTVTPITLENDDGSERDEAEGDEDEIESESDDEDESEGNVSDQTKTNPQTFQPNDEINKVPCILIFDSLAGASRVRVVATLRDYLKCEYKAKMGSEKEFSKDTIKGACPKVPQQSNFTDCGLYVLQYVESFFKNPITDYKLPIKTLKNWFEEIVVTRKREEIADLLKKLVNNTKRTKPLVLPNLIFPTVDGKLRSKSESETKEEKAAESEEKRKNAESGKDKLNDATSTPEKIEGSTSKPSNQTPTHESTDVQKVASTTPNSKSSMDTVVSLKKMRLPRLQKSENSEDKPLTKKHKAEHNDSCK